VPVIDDFLFDDTYTADDWLEDIGESRSDSIAHDGASCTIPVYCAFAKYKACRNFIMGYSYVDETKKLRRKNPIWHPVDGWMRAHKIVSVGFSKATGKTDGPWAGGVKFAVYTWARLVVEFQHVVWPVLEDDDITYETERYTVLKNKPYNELVQVDGGNLRYYCPGVGAPLNGSPLQSPRVYMTLQKGRLALEWKRVPVDFIEDGNGNRPKFAAIEKRVNSTTFLGRTKETLLCETVETSDPYPAPIATDVLDEPMMMVDVTVNLLEFNPDRGDTSVDAYGWQLLPGSRRAGTGGQTALGWYYATHDATLAGKPLYEEYDYHNFFTHYSL
jgi:hypothetical protein